MRLGVVVNPTAGGGRGLRTGREAIRLLDAAGHDVVNLSATTAAGALGNARSAVRHRSTGAGTGTGTGAGERGPVMSTPAPVGAPVAAPIDALVVVGGDGMVHLGVNAVAGTGVPLGIVATGSGNDSASVLGLPVRDVPASAVAIARGLEGGPRVVDAGHVRSADGRETWFCGALSAGLDAAINARANALTWPGGPARYVRAAASELRGFVPYGYRIVADDRVWESPGTLVAVANGPRIGGGIRIAPTAVIDDGLLDVVVAAPFGRLRVARIFPGLYRGRHLAVEGVQTFRARRVTIEPTTAGAPPPVAFADGETVGALPVTVEVRPGALHVLAPRSG
ncbi:hypothetical protein GCM10025865_29210 [Paraoerskovia sediminicola]|uniref:DAGKc domain-containing protein n=1 Tax=Paraoerskovia sediminicola TaxID=1138587 RepID=A0ABM8G6C6_9CELL|nr:diacylglycerol kinase family protein [Paraoerskovia sediminicola]BDZ43622.1 hypothetical protein GCM10025865_29210 [Paraoerskovia sediminicola]